MVQTAAERLAEPQFERETSGTEALREGLSVRTITLVLLGTVLLVVLASILATIRISYRPNRGC